MSTKKTVTTKNVDGKEINLIVRTPNASDLQKAQMESNKVFRLALDAGAVLRTELNAFLRKRGLWNDDMENQLTKIADELYELEKKLMKGGIKRSEAKDICIRMRVLRYEQSALLYNQRQHDIYTVEAQAENAKFDYLVSCSVFDEEGNRYFTSLDDYKARANEDASAAVASALAELVNNYDPDWEKDLPENKFLLEHKFVNEKLKFVNKDNKVIDSEGRLIDDNGRFINENGEFVNRDGELVDKDGMPIVEFQPLIDDEEEPQVEKVVVEEVKTTEPVMEEVAQG